MSNQTGGDNDPFKTLIENQREVLQGLVNIGVSKMESLESKMVELHQTVKNINNSLEEKTIDIKQLKDCSQFVLNKFNELEEGKNKFLEAEKRKLENEMRERNQSVDKSLGEKERDIKELKRSTELNFRNFEAEKIQLFQKKEQDGKIKEMLKIMKFYEDKKKNLEEEFKEIHKRIDSLQTFWRERVLMYIGIGGFLLPKPDCNDWLSFSSILLFGIMEICLSVYWIYTSLRDIFREIDQLVSDNSDIQVAASDIIRELSLYDDQEIKEVYTSQLDGLRVTTFDTITSRPLPGTKMKIIHGAWIIIPFLVSIIFGVIVAYRQAKTCTNPPSAISPSSTLSFI